MCISGSSSSRPMRAGAWILRSTQRAHARHRGLILWKKGKLSPPLVDRDREVAARYTNERGSERESCSGAAASLSSRRIYALSFAACFPCDFFSLSLSPSFSRFLSAPSGLQIPGLRRVPSLLLSLAPRATVFFAAAQPGRASFESSSEP